VIRSFLGLTSRVHHTAFIGDSAQAGAAGIQAYADCCVRLDCS
jgi:hypothetical protein